MTTSYWRVQHAADPLSADHRSQIGLDEDELGAEAGTSCCASFSDLLRWARGGHADWIHADLAVIEFHGEYVGQGTDGEPVVIPTHEVRRIPFRTDGCRGCCVRALEALRSEIGDERTA